MVMMIMMAVMMMKTVMVIYTMRDRCGLNNHGPHVHLDGRDMHSPMSTLTIVICIVTDSQHL